MLAAFVASIHKTETPGDQVLEVLENISSRIFSKRSIPRIQNLEKPKEQYWKDSLFYLGVKWLIHYFI